MFEDNTDRGIVRFLLINGMFLLIIGKTMIKANFN